MKKMLKIWGAKAKNTRVNMVYTFFRLLQKERMILIWSEVACKAGDYDSDPISGTDFLLKPSGCYIDIKISIVTSIIYSLT